MELGCVATVDFKRRTIFVADAHRGDGKRFVVHAEEKLTAFLELERRFELATNCLGKFLPDIRAIRRFP